MRPGTRRCDSVLVEHLPRMKEILEGGQAIKGTILSQRRVEWGGSICYRGILKWYVVPVHGEST